MSSLLGGHAREQQVSAVQEGEFGVKIPINLFSGGLPVMGLIGQSNLPNISRSNLSDFPLLQRSNFLIADILIHAVR